MGRPIEFDPEKVVAAAMDTFWSHGYEATSMAALLKATGLSKSSLYQAFGGKKELFQECLDRYRIIVSRELMTQLDSSPSGRDFIRSILNSAAEEATQRKTPRGCLIVNTANEFSRSDAVISGYVSKAVADFRGVFFQALDRARREGDVSRSKDLHQLSNYLVSSMSGLRSMVKSGSSTKEAKEVVGLILKAIE